jgi:NAD(P)-dependent dehydrogenase (short-subunit alcohol dehydrogenase family)
VDNSSPLGTQDKPLLGKVAIVTGASRGIGRGLVVGLAEAGADVVCAARTVVEEPGGLPGTIHDAAAAVAATGRRSLAVRCDVGIADDISALIDQTVREFGRIDVLVNNAMAPTRGGFEETTPEMWDMSMTTNVRSLFLICRGVVPHMAANGGGSIINISSGAAEHASNARLPPGYAVYAVAKAAMERFSTVVAPELVERGVAINALRPGAVKTELATRELGEDFDWSAWQTPQAVVPAVVFLAQQRPGGFSGHVVASPSYGTAWP